MEEVVKFKSIASNLLVSFKEKRMDTRHGALPYRPARFKDGLYEINPTMDYGEEYGTGEFRINLLRSHKGNRVNGGNQFYELDQNAIDVMEMSEGKLVAREPQGGITPKIDSDLKRLQGYIKDYDKGKHHMIVQELKSYFDVFSIRGVNKPDLEMDNLRVQGRLIEFFGILKERKIWPTAEDEGK